MFFLRLLVKLRNAWGSVNGLITIPDILGTVGFWLYRGTAKRTTAVGIAMLALFVLGRKTDTGVSLASAVTGTGLILLLSFIGGLVLIALAGSFSRRSITIAEAKGSNLLEDMKKRRSPIHCQAIWQCVYQYELRLAPSEQIEQETRLIRELGDELEFFFNRLMVGQSPALTDDLREALSALGLTRRGWEILFDYAVFAPVPRSVLQYRLRYDLGKVKDWYDGAPFHQTDTKLQEQFSAAYNLNEAKRDCGIGVWFDATFAARRATQAMWFRFITRAIQLRVAGACRRLDSRYPNFGFCPDHFLWPTDESIRIVREQLGDQAVNDLTHTRQRLFQHIFNPNEELAHAMLHRAIYPNFAAATMLRRRYDPQYVLGDLDQSWEDDLLRYNRALVDGPGRGAKRRRRCIEQTRQAQAALHAYLAANPDHAPKDDVEGHRALAIAAHTNDQDLRALLLEWQSRDRDDPLPHVADPAPALRRILHEKGYITRRLRAVRLHHTLTRLELEDYEFYLKRILA